LLFCRAMKHHTLDRSRYAAGLLARVASGWRRLADDERRGVVAAARVTAELTAAGAPPALLATAARIVQDEVHHVEVCARILEALKDEGDVPRAIAPRVDPTGRAATSLAIDETAVARMLVTELALGKPVTASSFASARAVVREPLFAWAYTELLRDETRHATFGAKAAAWVIRNWSTRQRQALWTECLTVGAPVRSPRLRDAEAEALGLLPGEVDGALPRWILPHLAPLGIQPRSANVTALIH
jgi:hypothetical protein